MAGMTLFRSSPLAQPAFWATSLALHAMLVVSWTAEPQLAGHTSPARQPAILARAMPVSVDSSASPSPPASRLDAETTQRSDPGARMAQFARAPLSPIQTTSESLYVHRSDLTRPPAPLQAVLLTCPEEMPVGRYRGVLTVFVDEAGTVRHVRAQGHALGPVLEDAARQAFLSTPFTPGFLGNQAVKSRIDIEVEFEHRQADGRRSL